MHFSIKKALALLFTTGVVVALFLLYANNQVNLAAKSSVWNHADKIPFNPVGLVPGTKPGGPYFRNRIDSAVALYKSGKVKWLIVSGDNRYAAYNEPQAMQQALMKKGIAIMLASRRWTLSSVPGTFLGKTVSRLFPKNFKT